ncbi:winged helix DNA-binding domain-containing protein [Cellulomonas palmilytica]|uniref:winged helix DNA-binding domain-containing protein n=1 Tax=Cellulomonas palmilytica TaxID=2608402 RepID=UPI001F2C6C89|nr:winged helix DNA-binding domain-containing protein [Cellulomonas palmilytica]UJP40018.1 AlkZ family DNA glycosylase [Cellulomonas palmilytica]
MARERPPVAGVVDTAQRRARLARRHGLVDPLPDLHAAVRALVVLHGTDASGPYLAAWARVPGFATSDLDDALYRDRTVVRQLAMRRTLWVTGTDLLPALVASPGARVAGVERRRLLKELGQDGRYPDPAGTLARAEAGVLAALADGRCRTAAELRAEVPDASGVFQAAGGTRWAQEMAIMPRLLTMLSADGLVVRGENRGGWTTSRPAWTLTETWLGGPLALPDDAAAHTAIVARWLRAFGPGTERDLQWWLGSTLTAVRRSLVEVGAVPVGLEGTDSVGWLLPDDLDPVERAGPWAALLPALDPTTMGWAERDWYLGPHAKQVVDAVGNAGPTVWVDGRVVGAWAASSGTLEVALLEDVPARARAAIDAEAERLTAWLAGGKVPPTFPSPLFGGRRHRDEPAVGRA